MRIEHLQADDERETIIAIEGLPRSFTLIHITDSHMAAADQRDPDALEAATRFQTLFEERTPNNVPASQVFEQALARSNELDVDCTLLTGDIIHFPAHAALELIARGVQSLQSPYLYTLGNHDWHFPHSHCEGVCRGDRTVFGQLSTHDLDEWHLLDRVEEVHPEESTG